MKVRVSYTVEVDDDYRRAINAYYGRPGLATRAQVVTWLKLKGQTMDDEIFRDAAAPDEEQDEYED